MGCDGEEKSSLRSLAAKVCAGAITATQLVEASLSRIADAEPDLGAVVAVCADAALERAAQLDRAPGLLPLAGLPVLVKDNQDVRGLVTSHGSALYADSEPALATGEVPRRLEEAGAIIVGKSNLSELASEAYTTNPCFGSTGNPWNGDWNPGGSSGGSAAALAAGLVAVATGTDGGGSIRIPAAWCGLLGLKPTSGLIGRRPTPAWMDLSTTGVLAQRADDLALLLQVMARSTDGDIMSGPDGLLDARSVVTIHRIVAVPRIVGRTALPDDVERCFLDGTDRLADALGARLEVHDPGSLIRAGNPDSDWFRMSSTEQAWAIGERVLNERGHLMDPLIHHYLMLGLQTSTSDYVAARRRRYAYAAELDAALPLGTLVVTPTATIAGIARDGVIPGRSSQGTQQSTFTTKLMNLTGHPALSIPAGILDNGLPFGLQVITRRWDDATLVHLATRWEAESPWPTTAPDYSEFGCGLSASRRKSSLSPVTVV